MPALHICEFSNVHQSLSRELANGFQHLKAWLPITYAAFMDYRMGGASISSKGLAVIKRMLAGENVTQETSGMSKGEWRELMAALDLKV